MALIPLFSRREREAQGDQPDVYVYDAVDSRVRVQMVQIVDEVVGDPEWGLGNAVWTAIRDVMRKELGTFALARNAEEPRDEVLKWFIAETNTQHVIDAIELFCLGIDRMARDQIDADKCDAALLEVTGRLREAGIGYEVVDGRLVKVSSQLIHKEAVLPALKLLAGLGYEAANEEFRKAHQHYREGRLPDCVRDCGNAFESVLKVICAKRGWAASGATAKPLLDAVLKNGLVPEYLSGQFNALRALLEGGVPTVRNKNGGHGAGVERRSVSDHLVSYQLHQTAAAILFLVQSEEALPQEARAEPVTES